MQDLKQIYLPANKEKLKIEKNQLFKDYLQFEIKLGEDKIPYYELWISERKNLEVQLNEIDQDLNYYKGSQDQIELKQERKMCCSLIAEVENFKKDYEKLENILIELWKKKKDCKDPEEIKKLELQIVQNSKQLEGLGAKFNEKKMQISPQRSKKEPQKIQQQQSTIKNQKKNEQVQVVNNNEFKESEELQKWKIQENQLKKDIIEFSNNEIKSQDPVEKEQFELEKTLGQTKISILEIWVKLRERLEKQYFEIQEDLLSQPNEQQKIQLDEEQKLNKKLQIEIEQDKKEFEDLEIQLKKLKKQQKKAKNQEERDKLEDQLENIQNKIQGIGEKSRAKMKQLQSRKDVFQFPYIGSYELFEWKQQEKELKKKIPLFQKQSKDEQNQEQKKYMEWEFAICSEKLPFLKKWNADLEKLEFNGHEIVLDLADEQDQQAKKEFEEEQIQNNTAQENVKQAKKQFEEQENEIRNLYRKIRYVKDQKEKKNIADIIKSRQQEMDKFLGKKEELKPEKPQKSEEQQNSKKEDLFKEPKKSQINIEKKEVIKAQKEEKEGQKIPAANGSLAAWRNELIQFKKEYTLEKQSANQATDKQIKEFLKQIADLTKKKLPVLEKWIKERENFQVQQETILKDLGHFKDQNDQMVLNSELGYTKACENHLIELKNEYCKNDEILSQKLTQIQKIIDSSKKEKKKQEIESLHERKQIFEQIASYGNSEPVKRVKQKKTPYQLSVELKGWKKESVQNDQLIEELVGKLESESDQIQIEFITLQQKLGVQKQPQYTMWVGCKMDIEKIKLAIKDDIDYFTEETDQERLKEEQKQIQVQEFELRKIKKNYEQQEKDIIELAEKKTQALTNEDKIQMAKEIEKKLIKLLAIQNQMREKFSKGAIQRTAQGQKVKIGPYFQSVKIQELLVEQKMAIENQTQLKNSAIKCQDKKEKQNLKKLLSLVEYKIPNLKFWSEQRLELEKKIHEIQQEMVDFSKDTNQILGLQEESQVIQNVIQELEQLQEDYDYIEKNIKFLLEKKKDIQKADQILQIDQMIEQQFKYLLGINKDIQDFVNKPKGRQDLKKNQKLKKSPELVHWEKQTADARIERDNLDININDSKEIKQMLDLLLDKDLKDDYINHYQSWFTKQRDLEIDQTALNEAYKNCKELVKQGKIQDEVKVNKATQYEVFKLKKEYDKLFKDLKFMYERKKQCENSEMKEVDELIVLKKGLISQLEDRFEKLKQGQIGPRSQEIDDLDQEIQDLQKKLNQTKDPESKKIFNEEINEKIGLFKALQLYQKEKDFITERREFAEEKQIMAKNDEDRDYYTKNMNRQDEKLEIIKQWKGQYDYDRDNIITIDKDKNVEKDVKKKLLLQKQRIKFEKDLTNLSEWIYQYSQIQDELREHQEKRDKSMDKKLKEAQDKFINAFEDKLRDLEEYRNEKQKLQNFIKDLNLRIEESQDNKTTENLKQYIAEAQYIINNLDKEKQFKDNLQNIIIRNKEEQKKPKSQQEYDQLQQGINEAIEKQQDFEKDRQLKIQLNNLLKEEQKKQDETSTKDLEKLNQIQKKKQILVAELKQLYNWRQNQYEQEEKVQEIQKRLKLEEDPIQKAKIQKQLELRKTKGKELEQWKKDRKKYVKKLIQAQNNLDEANSQEQKSEQDIEKLESEIINIQGKIRKLDNNRKEHSYQLLFDSIDQKLNQVGEDIVMINVLETIQKEAKQFQAQQKDLVDDENDLNKVIKDAQRNIEKGLETIKQNRQQITEIFDQKEKSKLEDDIIKINKKIEETKPEIKEFAEDLVDLDLYFANKDYWEIHLRNGRYLLALSKDAEEKKFLDGLVKLSLEKVKEIEDQRLERKELKLIGKQARNILASDNDAKSRQLAKEDEKTVNLGLQVLQNIIKKQCEYERELEEIKNLHRMERKNSEKLIKEKEIIQLNQKIQQLMEERRKQRQERNKKREEVLLMIQKRKEEEERKKLEEEKKKREEEEKRKKEEEEKKQRREQRRLIRKQAEQENQRRQNTFRKEKEGLIQQLKKLIETRDGNGKAKSFESKLSSFQSQLIKTRTEMAKIAKEKEKIEAKIDGFRDKQRQLEQKMDGINLTSARQSCNKIDNEDISFIKNLKNPPIKIIITLECVCCLIYNNYKKLSWDDLKKLIQEVNFRSRIINYDPFLMSEKVYQRIKLEFLNSPDWDIQKISRSARAAGYLADWAEQVVKYREILMQNQPILEQAQQLSIEEKTLHDDIIKLEELIRSEAQLKENEELTIEQIEKIKKQKEAFEREAAKFQPQIDELENELLKYHTEDLQLEPLIEIETQQDVIN